MAEISSTGDQMLQLLELVAFEGPQTTAELASAAGINRTVAHRLLNTLHARGYLSRQGKDFALGPILTQMASTGDLNGILRIARPFMRELADEIGETVVLHRIDGDNAVVVEQAVSEAQVVRVQHREGSRHSLCSGASGRALLAWQPDRLVQRLVGRTEQSAELRRKLEETRASGYATSRDELQLGVVGAAVPLAEAGGIVRFSLAVLVPSQRAEKLEAGLPALLNARRRIESQVATEAAIST